MTVAAVLALAAVPTIAGLAMVGLADPKRRRSVHEPPAPRVWRRRAALGLAAVAAAVAAFGGVAALLVWASASALAGWALSHALAAAPAAAGRRGVRLAAAWRGRPRRATDEVRRDARTRSALSIGAAAALAGCALALRTAWSGEEVARAALAVEAASFYEAGRAERNLVRPCLHAFAAADRDAMRDLVAGRAVAVTVPDRDGLGGDLQMCLLGRGSEDAAVSRDVDAGGDRFTVDAGTTAAIAGAVVRQLMTVETLAELAERGTAEAGTICRLAVRPGLAEVRGFVEALRRDRLYPGIDELLRRIPLLDRLDDPGRPDGACSS